MCLSMFGQMSHSANADDKSRRIVGGILRILVESHVDRGRNSRPQNLTPAGRLTPELTRSRPQFAEFSREASSLSSHLQQDAARDPALRPLTAETLRFQAATEALARRILHSQHFCPARANCHLPGRLASLSKRIHACSSVWEK